MTANHFCLKWNNYPLNMVTELNSLRTSEDLVDVTLSCDGRLFKAHKVVLSMCSSYFRNMFKENPCRHPIVILKDINQDDVEALLNFVYRGTVYLPEKNLISFLRTAQLLQIRGLAVPSSTIHTAL